MPSTSMAGRIARERNPCIRSATGVERTQNDIGKGLCLGHGLPQVQARQIAADIDGSARPTNRLRGAAPRGEMRMARRPGEHRAGLGHHAVRLDSDMPSIDINPPVDGKSHPRHRSVVMSAQTGDALRGFARHADTDELSVIATGLGSHKSLSLIPMQAPYRAVRSPQAS